jgi:hypothetical protein
MCMIHAGMHPLNNVRKGAKRVCLKGLKGD